MILRWIRLEDNHVETKLEKIIQEINRYRNEKYWAYGESKSK